MGGGNNTVNVILVDFRGYDTFGEITVLGIAGIGVLALLDGFRTRRPRRATRRAGRGATPSSRCCCAVWRGWCCRSRWCSACYIYWRGHGLPGGGFIAGLVTAAALVLQYMALGQVRAENAAARRGRAPLRALDRHRAGHRAGSPASAPSSSAGRS